jgi:hypothetical protein
MKKLFVLLLTFYALVPVFAQKEEVVAKPLTPYIGVIAGGCVDNPFSFLAGVQKPVMKQLTLSYDLHYWNTGYECYCDDMYSKGKFTSFTPSVKISYNTGKKESRGFILGAGLGYMFARDRGTEQPYTYDVATNTNVVTKEISKGNWDFNSIAPSVTLGVGFRLFKMPVAYKCVYYFANTTDGWMAAAGGVGFTIGFRKIH